jgi:dipeptidase E
MANPLSLMLISSSYVYDNNEYLGYCKTDLQRFLPPGTRVLFVPFAYTQHADYTALVRSAFDPLGVQVTGAHSISLPHAESIVESFDVVFCGGGNTFLLLAELYKRQLIGLIGAAVGQGVRYMGSSAGANVACPTIGTTNDMPIVEPQSLTAFGFVPFNINPHYYERPEILKHRGETRRDRIREFLTHNDVDVLAMREGAILFVGGGEARLAGRNGAIVFGRHGAGGLVTEQPVAAGESVTFLFR